MITVKKLKDELSKLDPGWDDAPVTVGCWIYDIFVLEGADFSMDTVAHSQRRVVRFDADGEEIL